MAFHLALKDGLVKAANMGAIRLRSGTMGRLSMRYGALKTGLALAITLPLLAGCSSIGGMSSFGGKQQQVAVVANIGDYTADAALAEAKGHFRSGDFGHSAALYKRVVELSPKNAEGYVGLSASYDRLRRFDLSDRVYTALYQITGGTAQYYNNVGYSYMLRGNLTAALTNFRKAEKLDPGNAVVANNIQILANAARASRA
jgi:Flp pilus assembly protein TadD